jgi:hypothetical protein
LRKFAITSNCLFLIYAVQMRLWPIFLLHAILLPLNLARLAELKAYDNRKWALQMTDDERKQFLTYLSVAKNTHAWSHC